MITVSYCQIPSQDYIPAFTILLTIFLNEIIKASDFSTVKLGYPISDCIAGISKDIVPKP